MSQLHMGAARYLLFINASRTVQPVATQSE